MEELQVAIDALRRAREAKLAELRAIDEALQALEAVRGSGEGATKRPTSNDFEHLGITAATKRYLAQEGQPRSTMEIADALLHGGIKTRSKNFLATVYATLHNSRDVRRTDDGKWELGPRNTNCR